MTTDMRADFEIGRAGSRRRNRRMSYAAVARRYLVAREASLARTHNESMRDFIDRFGDRFQTLDDALLEYFRQFKEASTRAQAKYDKVIASIRADTRMSFIEQNKEIQKIRQPMAPAWTQVLEDAFIATWGEPRQDLASWNAEVHRLRQDELLIQQGLDEVVYVRSNWQRQVPTLLKYSSLDNSVAPVDTMTPAEHRRYMKAAGVDVDRPSPDAIPIAFANGMDPGASDAEDYAGAGDDVTPDRFDLLAEAALAQESDGAEAGGEPDKE